MAGGGYNTDQDGVAQSTLNRWNGGRRVIRWRWRWSRIHRRSVPRCFTTMGTQEQLSSSRSYCNQSMVAASPSRFVLHTCPVHRCGLASTADGRMTG
nr:hypothetical protein CFP56_02876 [Quercus suber]